MNIPELMGQILGLCSVALGGVLIHRITRLDVTLASIFSGVIAGIVITSFHLDIGLRAHHIQDLVFFVILPVLVFEAAWHIKPALLKRWFLPIGLLATLGVVISTGVMGAGLYYGVGHAQGFPWAAALLTGAILAATDPIAVVSKLRSSNAPEDLTTLFEGESLFNDATGVVLFTVVLMMAQYETASVSVTSYFLTVFFGGILLGLLAGLLLAIAILFVGQAPVSVLLIVFGAFGSFFVAEHYFHVSGIMAVVATAIVARICLREQEHAFVSGISITWDWLGLLLNTILFALMGLTITFGMFYDQWLAMIIAIAAALVARFVSVYFCSALTRLTRRPLPMDWTLVLAWGGLRGAVAIALVLSLPISLEYWWTVQSMVFAVVLFTLLIQGPTSGPLIRRIS